VTKFEALVAHNAIIQMSGSLNTLASSLFKIAQDIRYLGLGLWCKLGKLALPENEPRSSIMPGKGEPDAVRGSNYSLCKPLVIRNLLHSVRILSDGMCSFEKNLVVGLKANEEKISSILKES
jgi:fumarate hydratase class II